jgi:hypothetical protein
MFSNVTFVSRLFALVKATKAIVWLGSYGAESAKPVKIFSNLTWVADLSRGKPGQKAGLVNRIFNYEKQRVEYSGIRDALIASQEYPVELAQAFVSLLVQHRDA